MLLEEKYKVPLNKQDCTKFVFKALPQYLELKDRKKFKEQVQNIKITLQMVDEDIPSLVNEEVVYKTIMLVEIEVKEIKKVQTYMQILHKLFKAPTIIKVTDIRHNYIYSFAIKRLNKSNSEEVIVEDIVNTDIYDEIFSKYDFKKITNLVLNKTNKYEYYYELMLRNYIELNSKDLDKAIQNLDNSNVFYNIEKMKELYSNIKEYVNLNREYEKCSIVSQKIEIKKNIEDKKNIINELI